MRLNIFLYFITIFLFICSCSTSYIKEDFVKEETLPLDKFAFIEQSISVRACKLDLCIEDSIHNFGSGVFVGIDYNLNMSQILTADHICVSPQDSIKEIAAKFPMMKVEMLNYSFIINDYLGNQYQAHPTKQNKITDLCILEIDGMMDPIGISNIDLINHQKITNISAPHAIWDPNAIIVFDGRFNGINRNNFSVYSLPTHPGSSGSPILNSEGELVGIINLASETGVVGYGATQEEIREFLEQLR